jgi:outer membrane beta-barrel protein
MLTLTETRTTRSLGHTARWLAGAAITLLGALSSADASAASGSDHPAAEALDAFNGTTQEKNLIQNKFFLKENRFEVTPALGIMPNNAFVTNVYGGAVAAYHFSESFAAEGMLLYAPNTGVAGVKGLTKTLVVIAEDAAQGTNGNNFQQPLDRLQLGAIFAARWSPVYGKINLLGETVANFDLYGTGGLGLMLITEDKATYNPEFDNNPEASPVLVETNPAVAAHPALNLGIGMDFFITQSIALKLDARTTPYFAPEPDYGNVGPDGQPVELESRLYAPFLATAGVSIFVPKMKPRLFNF